MLFFKIKELFLNIKRFITLALWNKPMYPSLSQLFFLVLFCFVFSFLATSQHMEFPGQGSYPSHSCYLHCRCGNVRSLTHCANPAIEPVTWCCRDTAEPTAPQWELFNALLNAKESLCPLMLPTTRREGK